MVVDDLTLNYATPAIAKEQRYVANMALADLSEGRVMLHWAVLKDILQIVLSGETTRPLSLLDAGCGSAYFSEVIDYLLPDSFIYTGVDYNAGMVALAKDYYPTLRVLLGDICDLCMFPAGTFDVVLCSGALGYVHDWRLGLSELVRVSRCWVLLHRMETCTDRASYTRTEKAHGYDVRCSVVNEPDLLAEMSALGLELACKMPAKLGDSWAFLCKRTGS